MYVYIYIKYNDDVCIHTNIVSYGYIISIQLGQGGLSCNCLGTPTSLTGALCQEPQEWLKSGTRPVEPTACGCDCLKLPLELSQTSPEPPKNLKTAILTQERYERYVSGNNTPNSMCLIIIFPMKMTEHGNKMVITGVHDQTHHDTSNSSTDLTALRPSPSSPCISTWGATHQGPSQLGFRVADAPALLTGSIRFHTIKKGEKTCENNRRHATLPRSSKYYNAKKKDAFQIISYHFNHFNHFNHQPVSKIIPTPSFCQVTRAEVRQALAWMSILNGAPLTRWCRWYEVCFCLV